MDPATRKVLQDLANDEQLKNKTCVDCGAPRPQWASISFAVLICLQCAGLHRGFGVHISFVRSISMDTWQDDQLRRMKLGGNAPFMSFLRDYPADESGYTSDLSIHDKYHCWAASQYREKLTAALEDKPWSPSPPSTTTTTTTTTTSPPIRPSSAQGLRKSRASTRSPSSHLRPSSNSPSPSLDQKSANESYFATLGASNAARPDHLPPSQGGRYTGFGSTPTPDNSPEHLSSAAAPTLTELQSDPVRALSKGWSLFANSLVGASRAVSENVVKPGMEHLTDPALRDKVGGYVGAAGQRAALAAGTANAWGRETFGVDVGESVGGVVDKVKAGVTGGPGGQGYQVVDQWGGGEHADEEGSALFSDAHESDGHTEEWQDMPNASSKRELDAKPKHANEDWDEWKDF